MKPWASLQRSFSINSLRAIFHSILRSVPFTEPLRICSHHSKIHLQRTSGKPLRFWKWTKWTGLGLVFGGIAYQKIGTAIDAKRYPPIGQMISMGGYNIHLYTTGTGPNVILDAGLGCNALSWSLVQPEIARFARVTSFDRPGNGWSDESPKERTSQNIAMELHEALHKAKIFGPYVFVGHSFGGIDAQMFAQLYPDEVAGLILVESSHADQCKEVSMPEINPTLTMLASHLGISRLLTHSAAYKESVVVFPEPIQKALLAQLCTIKFTRTVLQEFSHFKTSCDQLKALGDSLGDKPITVITAGKTIDAKGSGMTQEQIDTSHRAFQRFQKDLVTKSSQGKQVFATESDHMIPYNQPQIIVDAAREMIAKFRN